jgi:hypothetical protein
MFLACTWEREWYTPLPVAIVPGALLHDMRQFVAEQLPAVHRIGLLAARRKIDVGADREGDGTNALGLRPDPKPNTREIGAECGLHLAAQRTDNGRPPPEGPSGPASAANAPAASAAFSLSHKVTGASALSGFPSAQPLQSARSVTNLPPDGRIGRLSRESRLGGEARRAKQER